MASLCISIFFISFVIFSRGEDGESKKSGLRNKYEKAFHKFHWPISGSDTFLNESHPINENKIQIRSGPYSFDYLLGENSYVNTDVDFVFIDHDAPQSLIQQYKRAGKTVICYVNVGAWEEWREDAGDFPESVLGNDYEGWEGERWLDIRNTEVLLPILRNRLRDAQAKGCSGIDPDNINGYTVNTGFPLTYRHQIIFNQYISGEIRVLGMLAGIKNDNEQATELINYFDFAVLESCAAYDECYFFEDYPGTGKPVFAIEYTNEYNQEDFVNDVCPLVQQTDISFILKHLELHGDFITSCI